MSGRSILNNNIRWVLASIGFISISFFPLNAYAYIDPNAGGWLFQMLFPLLVAIGGLWTVFRHRIGSIWHRLFRRSQRRE